MRLVQIKLAGFKSFADPTLIELKDAFTGIVGPNGCGKSNIIDAVRWVLGEGRVSELRGSSTMTELIFAGSTTRAPVGRAMVELVLDNSDGTVKGPWGGFADIAVRRVVTREGASAYFINHQQVRRRDVQEIFLGTGLGAKSYAIISQGMIADFIKAKPEELRGYIEEAAGVSLYKERRRETETLLRTTRENLSRAGDLQLVKETEIKRLREEAETAARWKELTEKKSRAESLWYFLQFEDARRTADEARAAIAKSENEIAEKKAALAEAEAARDGFEKSVLEAEGAHERAARAASEAEKAFARLEGEMKRLVEKRRLAERELADASATLEKKQSGLAALDASAQALKAALEGLEEEAAQLDEEAAAQAESLESAREEASSAAAAAEASGVKLARERKRANERDAAAAAARARLDELERRAEDVGEARASLKALEHPGAAALEAASEAADEAAAAAEEALALQEEAEQAALDAQAAQAAANEAYFSLLSQLKAASARLETLEDVQRLAAQGGKAAEWLAQTGLEGMPELAQLLAIDPEWVCAFEAVLENRVRAMLLRDLRTTAAFEKARPPVRAVFAAPAEGIGAKARIDAARPAAAPGRASIPLGAGEAAPALLQHVRFSDAPGADAAREALENWLAHVGTAPDLASALRMKQNLRPGELLVTPSGDIVTRASVAFWAADDPALSMLSREQEIRRLAEDVAALEDGSDEKDAARHRAAQACDAAKARAEEAARSAKRLGAAAAAERTKLAELRRAEEDYKRRESDLKLSAAALEKALAEKREALDEAEALHEEALEALEALESENDAQERKSRRAQERRLQLERDALKKSHELSVKRLALEERRAEERSLSALREELLADIERETQRVARARSDMAEDLDARFEAEVQMRLTELEALEKNVHACASLLESAKGKAAANERIARTLREQILPLTESLGDLRATAQQKETLREQFSERMDELGADWTAMAVLAETRGVKAATVRNEVSRFMSEIASLGPVNHAALEHLQAAETAYAATAAQIADLEKAILTLEAAIRKIDQETRARMRETFAQVNANFDDCFQGLFGGGRAALVMTGDEILSAGIEVIAQPPGKRNASVKLLSGGEQALTATALVFAMFRLNPAPFCLLDEVDAPLDEANQARLAALCRRMSSATQFLIITHHRVTMEFASSLIGVTMKEPGVSRVVSVDIEEAVRYAQTNKAA